MTDARPEGLPRPGAPARAVPLPPRRFRQSPEPQAPGRRVWPGGFRTQTQIGHRLPRDHRQVAAPAPRPPRRSVSARVCLRQFAGVSIVALPNCRGWHPAAEADATSRSLRAVRKSGAKWLVEQLGQGARHGKRPVATRLPQQEAVPHESGRVLQTLWTGSSDRRSAGWTEHVCTVTTEARPTSGPLRAVTWSGRQWVRCRGRRVVP